MFQLYILQSLPDSEISEHAINDVEIKHKRMEILKVQLGHCFPEISSLLLNCGHEDPDKRPKCTAIRQTIQVVQENVQRIYGRKDVKIPYVMASLEMVAKERRMQILEVCAVTSTMLVYRLTNKCDL